MEKEINEVEMLIDKEITLFLREEDAGFKYYFTKDEEFEVIERPDKFLLYRLNHKDDCYDWTETYHNDIEECKEEMKKLLLSN
jgi:guanylate kinase